jgi:hypothetical protein
MQDFIEWLITEGESTRYSVEVNYRTTTDEILEHGAKIVMGYASAGLKKDDYHVKQFFEEEPLRIIVSARNWDDGTWAVVVSWNPHKHCYIITSGFYNKDRKTVSYKKGHSKECDAKNASEITREVKNALSHLKGKKDKHVAKLKKVPLKRGPK